MEHGILEFLNEPNILFVQIACTREDESVSKAPIPTPDSTFLSKIF